LVQSGGNTTDSDQIQTWITGSVYDVRGDLDLDGDVDLTDKSACQSNNANNLGRGKLSLAAVGNRKGYGGYEADIAVQILLHVLDRAVHTELGRRIDAPIAAASMPGWFQGPGGGLCEDFEEILHTPEFIELIVQIQKECEGLGTKGSVPHITCESGCTCPLGAQGCYDPETNSICVTAPFPGISPRVDWFELVDTLKHELAHAWQWCQFQHGSGPCGGLPEDMFHFFTPGPDDPLYWDDPQFVICAEISARCFTGEISPGQNPIEVCESLCSSPAYSYPPSYWLPLHDWTPSQLCKLDCMNMFSQCCAWTPSTDLWSGMGTCGQPLSSLQTSGGYPYAQHAGSSTP
jgi:hypothetical protein